MYYLHLFSPKQPDLNWENPKVRDEVFNMMTWWFDKGIDGFRMDVISQISKDQRFPDGEKHGLYGDGGPYYVNGPRIHEFLQEMNRRVLSKYDIMTVGETPGATVENAPQYAGLDGKELNMVFQFEHVGIGDGPLGKWTTKRYDFMQLKKILSHWQTGLDGKAWNSLFWGNHDQPRAASRWGDDSPLSAKMLATCLLSLQGTPYIYEGDELGMTNAYFKDLSQYRDIESLNAFKELTGAGLISADEMMACLALRSRDQRPHPGAVGRLSQRRLHRRYPLDPGEPQLHRHQRRRRGQRPGLGAQLLQEDDRPAQSPSGAGVRLLPAASGGGSQLFAYRRTLAETGEDYLIACNSRIRKRPLPFPPTLPGPGA